MESKSERDMRLDTLGDLAIHIILEKLDPVDTAAISCVSKNFRNWASDDFLWLKFCAAELDLSSPLDPQGNSVSSFKAAYGLWREAFVMYSWPLVKRVKRCWGRLKTWLTVNFPESVSTLRRGASEDEIKELENYLKVKLPLPTRVLYRFYDGQGFTKEEDASSLGSSFGLLGGYSFYGHLVNVFFLPLKQVALETKDITTQVGFGSSSKYIVAACSVYSGKFFFLDCTSGQLYVGTRNLITDGEMLPSVPYGLISGVHDSSAPQQQDAMLLWLEEHARRLESGSIKLCSDGRFRGINMFPERPPYCSIAVTNGVQVRASAVFVPECSSNLEYEQEGYLFAYSIRMSLLREGCIIKGVQFSSCQLYWRHWIIRDDNGNVVSDVNGEGVIGQFPLLNPGEEEFVYESCTTLRSSLGSIEGSFTFVPGSLADPEGSPFEVEVARFPLNLPNYIF